MTRSTPTLNIATDMEEAPTLFLGTLADRGVQPFGAKDSTVGMEFELQVAVAGDHRDVDLPVTIRTSTYFKNVVKRSAQGDLAPGKLEMLREYLFHNESKVWENSWVRLAEYTLSPWTRALLARDLLADKSKSDGKQRSDIQKFRCIHKGKERLRVPVSYLLKLALGNIISSDEHLSPVLFRTGKELMDHFLSDNTSPEILSFTIPTSERGAIGEQAAQEALRTLLFSQVLIQYANKSFGLEESGQKCLLYSAPHAPARQKLLNELVPDGFYRHLFLSPCLSGWDRGEEKYRYMELCHKMLSRSQLNTIGKLKDAGILINNLAVLPNTSNTCLANNGIHVSLGSRCLTALATDRHSVYTPTMEKYCGDLVIKIVEHFLPLLVNTYSAAPYRIDYCDFHPEKVLGFLPHELDYTHLRMIWRRWRKKADISFLGKPLTPFGPRWLDRPLASLLRLRGDLVPDFRLIDYLVTLLSTETSPALNGKPGNHDRLKAELAEMGIFDSRMSIYLPYRQRIFQHAGYCGFEARNYSLFHSMKEDMAEAIDLQNLITALAYSYIINRRIDHHDIPDRPSIESERRQIFFATAIGIPTFYVRADTGNRFLRRILAHVRKQRNSRRYKGYIRVRIDEYKLALLRVIEADGAGLVAELGVTERLRGVRRRLAGEDRSCHEKIVTAVCGELSVGNKPLTASATDFNSASEQYYRTTLKKHHLDEAINVLVNSCRHLEKTGDPHYLQVAGTTAAQRNGACFIEANRTALLEESADPETLLHLARLFLAVIHHERQHLGTP